MHRKPMCRITLVCIYTSICMCVCDVCGETPHDMISDGMPRWVSVAV